MDAGHRSTRDRRQDIRDQITEKAKVYGIAPLCDVLGEPRATYYRSLKPNAEQTPRPRSRRRLSDAEEREILSVLNSERFCDLAPSEIYAILLDEGRYLCSERTMYRILKKHHQVVVRHQARPHVYSKPELLATRPNELWSWDITKLRGPIKWTYFYLYVLMDVFSRFVVGWMVAKKESAELAKTLIRESYLRHNVTPGTLTVHADNGKPMVALTVGELMVNLGVEKSHSRPHTSNDNPFSESLFKTFKYDPEFPDRCQSEAQAREISNLFFNWYNFEHRHSGIALLTPATVHYGEAKKILSVRSTVLSQAYNRHPERFVKGQPVVKPLPDAVWINPPAIVKSTT